MRLLARVDLNYKLGVGYVVLHAHRNSGILKKCFSSALSSKKRDRQLSVVLNVYDNIIKVHGVSIVL